MLDRNQDDNAVRAINGHIVSKAQIALAELHPKLVAHRDGRRRALIYARVNFKEGRTCPIKRQSGSR